MNDLKGCLKRLREVQHDMSDKAMNDAFDPRVRAAYMDAETKLSRALGELDFIVNMKV